MADRTDYKNGAALEQADFVRLLSQILMESGVVEPLSYDESSFCLRIGDGQTSRQLALEPGYRDFVAAQPHERPTVLGMLASSIAAEHEIRVNDLEQTAPVGGPGGSRDDAATVEPIDRVAPARPSSVTSLVGKIRIIGTLGQGGMGTVYLGLDEKLGRQVAVKVIRHDRTDDESRSRLVREAQLLSRLNHANICQVYELIESEQSDFLVLEYIEGHNLRQALAQGIDREGKLRIAEQLAEVLLAAHARAVVHRDLKPENIMLTADGTVKVLDFGIARCMDAEIQSTIAVLAGQRTPETSEQTTVGMILGTVGYMSPEQARGEPVTTSSDMYALGLVLQELFTGQRPFDRAQPSAELLRRAAAGISEPVSGLGRELSQLIVDLKTIEPEARPTAKEARQRLRSVRAAPARKLRRAGVAAAAVLVVVAAAKYAIDLRFERQAALVARNEALAARGEVEELLDFMVEDLYDGLESLGRLDLLKRAAEKAARYYSRSRSNESLGGEVALRRSLVLKNTGWVLHMEGDSQAALASFARARELAERNLADTPDDVAWLLRLAEIDYQIGYINQRRGDLAAGEAALKAASTLIDRLPVAVGRELEWRQLASRVYAILALTHAYNGELELALEVFDRGRVIQEALVSLEPDNLEGMETLGSIYDGIGNVLRYQGRAEEALERFRQAEESYAAAVAAAPSDVGYRYALATAKGRRGETLLALGQLPQAQRVFQEALEIMQRLVATDPSDSRWQQELALGHGRLASALMEQGNLIEAAANLDRAITVEETLFVTDSSNLEWANNLAYDLVQLGVLEGHSNNQDRARSCFERAVEVLRPRIDDSAPQAILDTYAIGLLHLGRIEEARPVVEGLLSGGWQGEELVELAREHGLLPADG